jgi:hypothetical protein
LIRVIGIIAGALAIGALLAILGAVSYVFWTLPPDATVIKVIYFAFLAACVFGIVAAAVDESR